METDFPEEFGLHLENLHMQLNVCQHLQKGIGNTG